MVEGVEDVEKNEGCMKVLSISLNILNFFSTVSTV